MVRRRPASSLHAGGVFLGGFFADGFPAGLCSVPSVVTFLATVAGAASFAAFSSALAGCFSASTVLVAAFSTFLSALRLRAFSFAAKSAACRAINSACLRASSLRVASCSASTIGFAAAALSAFASFSATASRLTSTRFLRTSTWIVRAGPRPSVFRISDVCRRVRVMRFLLSVAPCDLRRYSSNLVLSLSVRAVSSLNAFLTPAALSCSTSFLTGSFNSVANWATFTLAI